MLDTCNSSHEINFKTQKETCSGVSILSLPLQMMSKPPCDQNMMLYKYPNSMHLMFEERKINMILKSCNHKTILET